MDLLFRLASLTTDFIRAPDNRYVVGRGWFAFYRRDAVAGLVIWGSPDRADVELMLGAVPVEGSPLARSLPRYIDIRRLETVDQAAIARFIEFFRNNANRLGEIVVRVAIAYQGTLGQALASGFSSVTATPYEARLFGNPVDALTWLGCRSSEALADELELVQAHAAGTTPLVRELRAYFADHLRTAELATAADALGLSPRSLQRKLRDQRTSFQRELGLYRVEIASRLLAGSDASIAKIASEVGCASAQHFGMLFRKLTGQTPRQWRADHRG